MPWPRPATCAWMRRPLKKDRPAPSPIARPASHREGEDYTDRDADTVAGPRADHWGSPVRNLPRPGSAPARLRTRHSPPARRRWRRNCVPGASWKPGKLGQPAYCVFFRQDPARHRQRPAAVRGRPAGRLRCGPGQGGALRSRGGAASARRASFPSPGRRGGPPPFNAGASPEANTSIPPTSNVSNLSILSLTILPRATHTALPCQS